MISLMIVAGVHSKNLARFLEERGTFQVDFIYNDLHSNTEEIMNQIVKVDKLLYLYQIDEENKQVNLNIRADMQTLRVLLQGNGFFSPGDIIFLCNSEHQCGQAKKYFTAVMGECKKKNFTIKSVEGVLSFSAIYDNLIGITLTKDFKNTYRPLYRVERGADSNIMYEKADDSNLIIEPFHYDNLKNWESQKKVASSIESGIALMDESSTHRQQWSNPDLGYINFDDILPNGEMFVIGGERKTGKSVWAVALASSAFAAGKKVCVYDFTKRQDVAIMCQACNTEIKEVTPSELININNYNGAIVCSIPEHKVLLDFMKLIMNRKFSVFDVIIVVIELADLLSVLEIVEPIISQVLVTANMAVQDIDLVIEKLSLINKDLKIILNEYIPSSQWEQYRTPEQVKELCPKAKVIKPRVFHKINVGSWLYCALRGEEYEKSDFARG